MLRRKSKKNNPNNNIDETHYKDCGKQIIGKYGEDLVANILRENEGKTKYNDAFMSAYIKYAFNEITGDVTPVNPKLPLIQLYPVHPHRKDKGNAVPLDPYGLQFINKLVAELKDYIDNDKYMLDTPPIFYSLTKGIISLNYNFDTKKYEMEKLYEEIAPQDIIRIWKIINSDDKPAHLVAEIVCKSGTSYSFGFFYDEIPNRAFSTEKLTLMSPDETLNYSIIRQINNPSNTYLEMVHESIIGVESHKRLFDLFDSICKDEDINSDTNSVPNITVNISSALVNGSEGLKELGSKINDYYKPKLHENTNNTNKDIELFISPLNKIYNNAYTYQSSLSNNKQKHKNHICFFVVYEINVNMFLGTECSYRTFSGKFANTVKRISNRVKRRSKSPVGINCARGLELLFKDLITCGILATRPSACKSKQRFSGCLTKKHTSANRHANSRANSKA